MVFLASSLRVVQTRRPRISIVIVTNGRYKNKMNKVSIIYLRLQEYVRVREKILRNHEQKPGPNAHRGVRKKMTETREKNKNSNNDKGYNKSNNMYGGN